MSEYRLSKDRLDIITPNGIALGGPVSVRKELNHQQKKIDELKKIIDYHKTIIEFCDCGNPRADCICLNKNGWQDSKQYKLEQKLAQVTKENELRKEALGNYASEENWDHVPMRADGEGSRAPIFCGNYELARECEEKIKRGEV